MDLKCQIFTFVKKGSCQIFATIFKGGVYKPLTLT